MAAALLAFLTLVCQGQLTDTAGVAWSQRTLEFSIDYAPGMQSTLLKSNVEPLNTALITEVDEGFLRGKEAQTRPLGMQDRSLSVSELRISRSTGQFTLAVSLFRDLDVLSGRALWEGKCEPRGADEKKF
jgi:hypothetical protein